MSLFFYASGSSRAKRLQVASQPLSLRFFHTQELDPEFIFQRPADGRHSNRESERLLWNITGEGHHPAHHERPVRDNLAPAQPEVVYDSRAFEIAGESCREFDDVSFMLTLVHALA